MALSANESWQGSIGDLIEAAAVESMTTATFGKFLAQHSVFMRSRGVIYSKRHTSTGQVVTLEKVDDEGSEGDEGYARIQGSAFTAFTAFIPGDVQKRYKASLGINPRNESLRAVLMP